MQSKKMSEEDFCRSATKEDLKSLIVALNEHGADYILIGGYALFAHGFERATTDIDLLVRPTVESYSWFCFFW